MTENSFAANQVTDMEIEAACARVVFKEAAGDAIRVEAENLLDGDYTCELRGNRLVVIYEVHGRWNIGSSNIDRTYITLYIPANHVFGHIELKIAAGRIQMEEVPVSCGYMDAELGAGKWKAERLLVTGRLSIEAGAGKAKLQNVKAGSLEVECGAGECVYEGRVEGDVKVECGVGKCELYLQNKESDFDYDISCALGSVRVNGSKIKSMGSQKRRQGTDVLGKAVLECGVGKIVLETQA